MERCVGWHFSCLLPYIVCEIERTLKEMNVPHTKYDKDEVERYKLEIQRILYTLDGPSMKASVRMNASDPPAHSAH